MIGYTDANGIEFESYEHACYYYGCDTPAQLAAEARYEEQEGWIEAQDEMEARGGPRLSPDLAYDFDDVAF